MKKVVAGGVKVNQLHSVNSNIDIDLSAFLAVVRPTLGCGSEVWEANKAQAATLESVVLGGAKHIRRVIDVVHSYCRKWRLKANVSKSAVMNFGKGSVGSRIC